MGKEANDSHHPWLRWSRQAGFAPMTAADNKSGSKRDKTLLK
jgi:hypothetical protein